MNNREFYDKWGKSPQLKTIVNIIVYKGLQMFTEELEQETFDAYNISDYIMAAGMTDQRLALIECYNDLRKMPDGFIKNVVKKVL